MLTIQNIGDLKGAVLANWKVLDAGEDTSFTESRKNIYVLTFARMDTIGVMQDDRAGVIIDRNINPLLKGYDIKIVYESWDYELHKTAWSKENIMNKDTFFGMIIHKIDTEYYKRK
jgi:hypothetical protein